MFLMVFFQMCRIEEYPLSECHISYTDKNHEGENAIFFYKEVIDTMDDSRDDKSRKQKTYIFPWKKIIWESFPPEHDTYTRGEYMKWYGKKYTVYPSYEYRENPCFISFYKIEGIFYCDKPERYKKSK